MSWTSPSPAVAGLSRSWRSATAEGSTGQQDSRFLGVATVVQSDVTDPLDDFGAGGPGQLVQDLVAHRTVADSCPHLDQFVVVQRPLEFGDEIRADAILADQDDRFDVVAEPAQVRALSGVERHGIPGQVCRGAIV